MPDTFVDLDDVNIEDLYPSTKKQHSMMLARCERQFTEAKTWRQSFEDRWVRYYKLSQSHVDGVVLRMNERHFGRARSPT